ncbi:hypothetical protein BJX99DRAFT_263446 [Aspergillus californicus]
MVSHKKTEQDPADKQIPLEYLFAERLELKSAESALKKDVMQTQMLWELDEATGPIYSLGERDPIFWVVERPPDHTYLFGTQRETSAQIQQWVESPSDECIYWLRGETGTGKTTIAAAIAKAYIRGCRLNHKLSQSAIPILGGSSFVDRDKHQRGDATNFLALICMCLVGKLPGLVDDIVHAMRMNPEILSMALEEMWHRLILDPLLALEKTSTVPPATFLVVIDGLNVCENTDRVSLILKLLAEVRQLETIRLRFLVTTTPDVPMPEGMPKGVVHEQVLERITAAHNDPSNDIHRYITEQMLKIHLRERLEKCPADCLEEGWPGTAVIERLVKHSDGLFGKASIACRYLGQRPVRNKEFLDKKVQQILYGEDISRYLERDLF